MLMSARFVNVNVIPEMSWRARHAPLKQNLGMHPTFELSGMNQGLVSRVLSDDSTNKEAKITTSYDMECLMAHNNTFDNVTKGDKASPMDDPWPI